MEDELGVIFRSVLEIRDTLEGSIAEIKSLVGQGHEAYAEPIEFLTFAARRTPLSSAPLLQDLWVLFELGEKRNGYFVEFGAAGGPAVSTTLLLETLYGWQGAIAEPARSRYDKLRASRNCYVTNKFIYTDDGLKMLFNVPTIRRSRQAPDRREPVCRPAHGVAADGTRSRPPRCAASCRPRKRRARSIT